MRGHEGAVSCVCASDGGEDDGDCYVISSSFDMTVRVWKKEDDEDDDGGGEKGGEEAGGWICSLVLHGHGCYVHTVATYGPFIYSAGNDFDTNHR